MTRRPITAVLPFLLASTLASAAVAQTPPQTPPPGGGMGGGMAGAFSLPRSSDQVAPWAARVFARLDANQDASLTGNELAILANPTVAAMGGSRMRAMIVQSDVSRDSRISVEEMTAGAERMFARMDRDGDGRLADDELPQRPAPPPPISIPSAPTMPTFPDTPPDGR